MLIPSPSYPNNFLDVKIMGGVPVAVELDAADGYQLSRAQLEAKYTARTRMVLLTHPNNPTTTITTVPRCRRWPILCRSTT